MNGTTIIGIDPGQHCGLAVFEGGQLKLLRTLAPHELLAWLADYADACIGSGSGAPVVVFEDSRLQSHVWKADGRSKASGALRIARNLGMVDGICAQIEAWCKDEGVRFIAVSPKGKGSKMDAAAFKHLTGWVKRVNQHERDAALLAWPYRSMRSEA